MLWDRLVNGDLMRAAQDAGFVVMITGDKNIEHQHNHSMRRIALVVLESPKWEDVRRNAQRIAEALDRARDGSYELVYFDTTASK